MKHVQKLHLVIMDDSCGEVVIVATMCSSVDNECRVDIYNSMLLIHSHHVMQER